MFSSFDGIVRIHDCCCGGKNTYIHYDELKVGHFKIHFETIRSEEWFEESVFSISEGEYEEDSISTSLFVERVQTIRTKYGKLWYMPVS